MLRGQMWKRWRQLAPYLRGHGKLFFLAMIAGALAGAASGFGAPFFMKEVFARFFESEPGQYSRAYQIGIAALLPAIFLLRGLSLYINQYLLHRIGQSVLVDLRQKLFDHLQALDMGFFEKQRSGDLLARLSADTTQIQNSLLTIIREAVLQPFIFAGGLGFLLFLSFREREIGFLLLLLAIAPLMILPVRLIGRHLRYRGRQMQDAFGEVSEVVAENLRAASEVRAFRLEERESRRMRDRLRGYFDYSMKMTKYLLVTQPLMELIAVTVVSIAFLYAYNQGLGSSVFLAMGAALFFTVDAIKRLVRALNEWQRTVGAFDRVQGILDTEPAIRDPDQPTPLPQAIGHLRFENTSFAYGDQGALKQVNVDIPPGTVCALVGPSGAGKSTFTKLILRFYDPALGRVLLDGHDLRQLSLGDLRRHIAYVPQAPVLFNDTVTANIRLGRADATDAEVEAAARAANADDFIRALPEGYDTVLGENATRLSGGQRQRLALARAFLRHAPILILDEATSALDSESDERIREALGRLVEGRTVLIVAHRFNTLQLARRILLFEDGRIAADGPIQTVLQHPTFRALYEKQGFKVEEAATLFPEKA